MKYLNPSFSVGPPAKVTACDRCVYGRGEHAYWCDYWLSVPACVWREALLSDYWNGQAQFGPFDVGPEEFVRRCMADRRG